MAFQLLMVEHFLNFSHLAISPGPVVRVDPPNGLTERNHLELVFGE
jgi:hypothetical protein